MTTQIQPDSITRKTFWTVAAFYFLIGFEFFYMASPFAAYFYSVYGPGLNFVNAHPAFAWLSAAFLPHIVVETSSVLLNLHNIVGAVLAAIGFVAFCIGAGQVYYHKLARKGAVTGGIYNIIRHPQYASLVLCSFGLLLLWPRYVVLLSFLTMLFAYYFLAKLEEKECEAKFGQSYREYASRTNMFLPFRLPLLDRLPGLPTSGVTRYLAIAGIYVIMAGAAIALANGARSWALDSLYAVYEKDAAYLAVAKMDKETLTRIIGIASANPDVQQRLANPAGDANAKWLNYVLPSEWHVSEIPMNPVQGRTGHLMPEYNRNFYKIVFTRAEMRANRAAEGKEIIPNTAKRVMIVEVWIDLAQNRVVDIKNPPAAVMYENVPVPVY